MASCLLSIRTNEEVKKNASKIFESEGMTLSTAINMFLRQTIQSKKYPCFVDYEIAKDYSYQYSKKFLKTLGAAKGINVLNEISDIPITRDGKIEI